MKKVRSVTISVLLFLAIQSFVSYSVFINNILCNLVRHMLKKHHSRLGQCFPHDYEKTITKLKQHGEVPDNLLPYLRGLPSVLEINKHIIAILAISVIKKDMDVLQFCDVLKYFSDYDKAKPFVISLYRGNKKLVYDFIIL